MAEVGGDEGPVKPVRPRGWVIEVCRTCDRLARFPFCEHRDERRPADAPSWCVTVHVIPASRRERTATS